MTESNPGKTIFKAIVGGIAVLFFTIVGACSMTTVDTGHVGAKVVFKEVTGDPLPAGLYFVNPFTTDIVEMDARVLRWAPKGGTTAYTKDVQQASIGFVLNYRLDSAYATEILRDVGVDWSTKLVGQVVIEDIKRELGQHVAVDLIAQRDAAARAIEANITKRLAAKRVIVTGFQLTDIGFTNEFEHAVEAKIVAQQEAIREQNKTVQIAELAKQQIVTAEGNAKATLVNANAEAESIRIRANALEQNAKLVQWEAVQKWDGKLPQYMLGNGAVPFVNVPTQ